MPKNIYLFQTRWLENERFKHWIRKKNDTVAICSYCCKDVSVPIMEEAALISHMKGKKCGERSLSDQCIKSLMSSTPASPLIKLVRLESGVSPI